MTSKHLITVDLDIKNEICKEISGIKNFKLSNSHQKVALVEKVWFDGLIGWLQSPGIPPPGKIRVAKLFSDKNFDTNLQLHTDFEIIDFNIWEKLYSIFGSNGKLFKYCRKHPKTRKITILARPIILSFYFANTPNEENTIKEVVDSNWEIYLIKDYICKKYRIEFLMTRF